MSLQCLYGQDTGIKYDELLGLSHEVAARSGKPVPPTKAIVGNRLFGWETGLPTGYWLKSREMNPLIMMPYHFSMSRPAGAAYLHWQEERRGERHAGQRAAGPCTDRR